MNTVHKVCGAIEINKKNVLTFSGILLIKIIRHIFGSVYFWHCIYYCINKTMILFLFNNFTKILQKYENKTASRWHQVTYCIPILICPK